MKNPFFYVTIGLSIVLISMFAYQAGNNTADNALKEPEEQNPILQVYKSLSPQAQALYYKQSAELTKAVPERIIELDEKTIGCFGPKKILSMSTADENLGGQCCGALMSFEAYELQLEALARFIEKNGSNSEIPRDPYDISVPIAQTLTRYDSDIVLNTEEQNTYDEAVKMSHHGGPCCCKCWKWYVMSGLAKKLIVDEGWNAHMISELWDISSSCGHDDDTNMYKHYNSPPTNDGTHHQS
jgi:hypothetical protein